MANLKTLFYSVLFSILLNHYQTVSAQDVNQTLTKEELSMTVDSINSKLLKNYIFPELAEKMAFMLTKSLKDGKYSLLVNPTELASKLTTDLQEVSDDKHLRVIYDPPIIARENALTEEDRANQEAEWIKELVQNLRRDNFGFKEVKLLEGNIGYLDLREFADPLYAGETLVAAMEFLSNAEALIIDLGQNDGGSPLMVQLLASYFFPSEPVHLTNFYNRPRDEHKQIWSLPYLPGVRRPDINIYLLTSNKTFSAAEALSYHLMNLERATIIGEKTAGGAHLTGSVIATDKFYVRIPQGRSINPVTKTDWEGVGVKPHIEVGYDQALITAHIQALEDLSKSDMDSSRIRFYNWTLDGLKARQKPVIIDAAILKSYTGLYDNREITYEKGGLYYRLNGGARFALIPLEEDRFIVDDFRIKFIKDKNQVVAMKRFYVNGRSFTNSKIQ